MIRSEIIRLLSQVQPPAVVALLRRIGFVSVARVEGDAELLRKPDGTQLIVPLRSAYPDYPKVILDTLELLEQPFLPLDDLLALLALPESDVVRYTISDSVADWGAVPLTFADQSLSGLYGLVRFTAAGLVSHRGYYTDVPPLAKEFARSCQLGQTEHSSFTLKLFCPVNPIGARGLEGDPFGRRVTLSMLDNIHFLASPEANDPNVPLPATMNRNIANSVEQLRPPFAFSKSSFSAWQGVGEHGDISPTIIDMDHLTFARAQGVSRRLKKALEFEQEVLTGFVVDLHKDRPTSPAEVSRRITLDVKYGSNWRKVMMTLLPAEYRQALRFHEMEQEILLDAILDKRSTPWSVAQLKRFQARDPSQLELFPDL